MSSVHHPMCHDMGIGHLGRLSAIASDRAAIYPKTQVCPRGPHQAPSDNVWLSIRARGHFTSGPVDLPPSGSPGGDGELAAAVRKVAAFLQEHPRIAHSPFGKSVQGLMRGAVYLIKIDGADEFLPAAKEKLLAAVRHVKAFLEEHPRVARSNFGQAVAELAKAIASAAGTNGEYSATSAKENVVGAAKRVQHFLDAHPRLAGMPLGLSVEKLISGVRAMGEGDTIDPDIQGLAGRIGKYVAHHPRLAQSEFGYLVAALTRSILALDAALPTDAAPVVVGDFPKDDVAPAANDTEPAANELVRADLQEAA